MKLIINGNDYHYAFEQLIRVFMPDIKLEKIYNSPFQEGEFILCETREKNACIEITLQVNFSECKAYKSATVYGDDLYKTGELCACKMLYGVLQDYTGYTPQWGMQTGVRPTKILFNLLRNNDKEAAVNYLKEDLLISEKKTQLIKTVCENEKAVMDSSDDTQFSLYVSIPFCPTRCAYCSFISHSYESIKKLIPDYVKALCDEIREIATRTNELGLKLRTVYIGGGTPTVLSEKQLNTIFDEIKNDFDLSFLTECTVEAGRPDTLTQEKLLTLNNDLVTRITINAQSFNDDVLKKIGRNHTALEIHTAFEKARKLGFHNINTDLIAGLEGESVDSFVHSLNSAIALGAENITVHTLALKRSSFLITRDDAKGKIIADTTKMIDKANSLLSAAGYIPYYMYRQSKSVGNLENTGWAKPGYICEYNIFMMEEVQHVFGAGAGAVTRLVNPAQGKIERIYNFKYPYEYLSGFNEMITRKQKAANIIKNWQKP